MIIVFIVASLALFVLTSRIILDDHLIPRVPQEVPTMMDAPR